MIKATTMIEKHVYLSKVLLYITYIIIYYYILFLTRGGII